MQRAVEAFNRHECSEESEEREVAITAAVLKAHDNLIGALAAAGMPMPSAVPDSDGALTLHWRSGVFPHTGDDGGQHAQIDAACVLTLWDGTPLCISERMSLAVTLIGVASDPTDASALESVPVHPADAKLIFHNASAATGD